MTDRITDESAGAIDYVAVEESARFQTLKRTQRSFIFPLAALFLIWYFVYVLLGAYATEFMGQRVWGDITVGLLLGLGQFVTTFAITMAYVAFANRKLDPKAQEIREELEKVQAGA
ncbi:DUF485 domain-containing protein [Microbacterium aerolatum]|uniref:Membrane protein n=1 Tax=Microbacterium aerolatum TaxID=153731 RepID=A0A511AGI7_9MICO|nr:DUF485 domain-containing protein [Microbacterium aerolatum]GEK87265.1 membrane protein [Microbacterium aerolatum]GGB35532.1 membrane protein [Microbacterium aerolatum]